MWGCCREARQHLAATGRPVTYVQHLSNAARGSARLVWAGLAGLVHAAAPCCCPFYTSTQVVRLFRGLLESGRHNNEIISELSDVCITVAPDPAAPGFERLPPRGVSVMRVFAATETER